MNFKLFVKAVLIYFIAFILGAFLTRSVSENIVTGTLIYWGLFLVINEYSIIVDDNNNSFKDNIIVRTEKPLDDEK